ncbi:MAG: SDR family oxidoreductase [Desulfobacterales bacterium]|jgi:dTDP-4-dehydrorhamnose reductase
MRILILGGDGMLGHKLFKYMQTKHDVKVTLHKNLDCYDSLGLFNGTIAYSGLDVRDLDSLAEILSDFKPLAVVNCVGIVKQQAAAQEYIPSIEINALFPHRLANLCEEVNARLLHLSTDCVFSGEKGNYIEEDVSDAHDLYGRTKFLGEVTKNNCITIRTSMIGKELLRKKGLLEWFLSQKGSIKGFKRAIFSGFTTQELSRIIEKIIAEHPEAAGLYHVSSTPISKFELLNRIREGLRLPIKINPDESFKCDRSLDSAKFRMEFNYKPPSWDEMIKELCEEIRIGKVQTDEARPR